MWWWRWIVFIVGDRDVDRDDSGDLFAWSLPLSGDKAVLSRSMRGLDFLGCCVTVGLLVLVECESRVRLRVYTGS